MWFFGRTDDLKLRPADFEEHDPCNGPNADNACEAAFEVLEDGGSVEEAIAAYEVSMWQAHQDSHLRESMAALLPPGGIRGTRGVNHSFDRHAAEWYGRSVTRGADFENWTRLVETTTQTARQAGQTFNWTLRGGEAVTGHLAQVEGRWFVTFFFQGGSRAGELATAYGPSTSQAAQYLAAIP